MKLGIRRLRTLYRDTSVKACKKTDHCVTFIYSSWLPAISLRLKKTSNKNYVWTSFFPSLSCLVVTSYYKNSILSKLKQGCGSSQIFNASASSLSWSFMLPSSLLLPHLWNFLLPLPAPDKSSRFRVRFCFQSFSSKCFRFHKNLTASTASASTSLLSLKQLIGTLCEGV